MGLSVIYDKKTNQNGLPYEIQIVITSLLFKTGYLKAILLTNLDRNEYVVYVRSYKPKRKIAWMLLVKINEIFKELAKNNKVVISHTVEFLNDESEMKLKTYYQKLGYTKKGEKLIKIFNPS